MTGPETYRVATEVAFVTTEDEGVVRLGQGDPLPENVHPDEVARLANGGVLEGIDQDGVLLDPERGDDSPEITAAQLGERVDVIKTRIGDDPVVAQAYLDAENAQEKPRPTLVRHLEGVIAREGEEPPLVSSDVEPGAVAVVDDEAGA